MPDSNAFRLSMRWQKPWMVNTAASSICLSANSNHCAACFLSSISSSRRAYNGLSVVSRRQAIRSSWMLLRMRPRNSSVAASVNVTTSSSSTVSGRGKAAEPPNPSSRRRYNAAIVNVLPVPAEASIRRSPVRGKRKGSRDSAASFILFTHQG